MEKLFVMRLLIVLFLSVFASPLFSQDSLVLVDQLEGKEAKSYERAQSFIQERDLVRAEKELSELLQKVPNLIEARIYLGHVQYEQGLRQKAIETYRRALALSPTFNQRLWYQFGQTLEEVGDYAGAADAYDTFIASDEPNEALLDRARRARDITRFAADAMANPLPFAPEPLPRGINTPEAEYLPSFTADQSFLVYTAVRRGQEDFYQSTREGDTWSAGTPITELNTNRNEGAQTISADGRVMVFTACDRPDGQGGCDLYISVREGDDWSRPQNMGPTINTRFWDSQPSLSANGRLLYFASARPGGRGKNDIWITYRQADGSWIRPVNAGAPINTPKNESAPFIHADGRTLYFMSDGHIGMGGYDLFLARLQADGTWEAPENLGYPINTPSNEGALTVQRDGKYAYFSKDVRDRPMGEPITDILRFQMPESIRPRPVTYVRARVLDAVTRKPLRAYATLSPVGEELMYYEDSTAIDGTFLICLPQGNDYALNVDRSGYLFYSDHFPLAEAGSLEEPYELEVLLQPITAEVGDTLVPSRPVVLRNVFFETASAALRTASERELNKLYALLTDQPDLRIRINGHTDDVGSDTDNQELSEARAKAVYQYLIDKGIDPARLDYKGFGESQPIETNDTAEGRQQNRRTEFEVLPNSD